MARLKIRCKLCGKIFVLPTPVYVEDLFCPDCMEWGEVEIIGCEE